MCVVCRTTRDKRALIRVVRTVDRSMSVDPSGRRSGRGAYVCSGGTCGQIAIAKASLSRALGVPLSAEVRAAFAAAEPQAAFAAPELRSDHPTEPIIDAPGGSRGQE
jgi:predicted RNA-binding protein YlxR (DUF448 family)